MWSIQVYVEKKSVFAKWWKERKYAKPVTSGVTGRLLCVVTWEGFQTFISGRGSRHTYNTDLGVANCFFNVLELSLLFLIKEKSKNKHFLFPKLFWKKKNAEKVLMITCNLSFFSFRTESIECNHGTCTPLGCKCDPCYTGDSCSEYSKYTQIHVYSVIPVIYLNKLVYIYIKMRLHDADDLDLYFQTICTPRSMSTWCLLPR